ncbi:MAG: hypothetical protein LUG59_01270, partial [Enterocloster clostridioformis]|nr:hypothetical protein [Enterocloster clostridioformis]
MEGQWRNWLSPERCTAPAGFRFQRLSFLFSIMVTNVSRKERILKLSDAYLEKTQYPMLELSVKVI